jgi:hypothetical protein
MVMRKDGNRAFDKAASHMRSKPQRVAAPLHLIGQPWPASPEKPA